MRKEQEAADMFSNLKIHILLSTLQQLAKHPGRPLQRHTSFFAWGVTPVLATIWDSWVWCCFVVVDQVLLGREEGIDFWLEWLISPIILLGGPPHPTHYIHSELNTTKNIGIKVVLIIESGNNWGFANLINKHRYCFIYINNESRWLGPIYSYLSQFTTRMKKKCQTRWF